MQKVNDNLIPYFWHCNNLVSVLKDNFSAQASSYAQFRPVYPQGLYDRLLDLVKEKNTAWDCGCGNGQVASVLSAHFDEVIATDISSGQIQHARQKPNINYRLMPAENTDIKTSSVDLITVAQAIHWFNFEEFYKEARRVGKSESIIAVWAYNLPELNTPIDKVIQNLYSDILGSQYWDPERKFIEENYQTIPFPFEEILLPEFRIETSWTLENLLGYLNSWSAVQHFIGKKNINPVGQLEAEFRTAWGTEKICKVSFPVYTRIGKVNT